jgi:hypothetical protein
VSYEIIRCVCAILLQAELLWHHCELQEFQRFFISGGVIIVMDIVTTSCESFSGKSRQMEVMRSFPATMRLYTSLAFAAVPGEESEENASYPALFHTRPSLLTRSSSTTRI